MGQDTTGRLPFRRVLDELRVYLSHGGRAMMPLARAFIAHDSAVMADAEASARVDRAEGCFLAVRSRLAAIEDPDDHTTAPKRRSRSTRPGAAGKACSRPRAFGRLRPRSLGSSRRALAAAEARETRHSGQVKSATDCLLSAPVIHLGDIVLKLAVIIAAGEPGPLDAAAFPWSHLRRLITEIGGMADVDR